MWLDGSGWLHGHAGYQSRLSGQDIQGNVLYMQDLWCMTTLVVQDVRDLRRSWCSVSLSPLCASSLSPFLPLSPSPSLPLSLILILTPFPVLRFSSVLLCVLSFLCLSASLLRPPGPTCGCRQRLTTETVGPTGTSSHGRGQCFSRFDWLVLYQLLISAVILPIQREKKFYGTGRRTTANLPNWDTGSLIGKLD